MAKISFYEVARVLVEHNKLDDNTANEFVKTMFDIIQESLTIDQQVKVRGLGTFKIVDVEARESINVNTGERILIEGHSKISFTPDSAMKELINKPFSQFETVMLNDGVNFEDAKSEEPPAVVEETPAVVEEPPAVVEETPAVVEETPVAVEETPAVVEETPAAVEETPAVVEETPAVVEETPAVVEETPAVVEETPAVVEEPPVIVEETPVIEENEQLGAAEEEESESRLPSHFKPVLIHLIYIIVVAALAGWGGYWYGMNSAEKQYAASKEVRGQRKSAVVKKVVAVHPTAKPDTMRKDTTTKAAEVKKEVVKEVEKSPADDYAKYAKMDARVRTGAYVIVGEKGTEKVRKGENVVRLSKRLLGEGMECYIEVFNGITADTPLKEGQVIKIPELKLKKSLLRKNKEGAKH